MNSNGKQYNGERACICLTSWVNRITTVGITLYNLLKVCPHYHIVLTLSEDEFPNKLESLPNDLRYFATHNLIEILWCKKNWRSFKKILFAMHKYPDIPIISADDDCLYKFDYASELLHLLPQNEPMCSTYWCSRYGHYPVYNTAGFATCYSPNYFGNVMNIFNDIHILPFNEDDMLYTAIRYVKNLKGCICFHKEFNEIVALHDETSPLHDLYNGRSTDVRDKQITELVKIVRDTFNLH